MMQWIDMGWIDSACRLLLGSGLDSKDISLPQMALRALIVYVVTLLIIRLAKKRFMGRASAFDMIVGVILGSTVSRAITGTAPLVPALGAALALVAMHWVFSWLAMHWGAFGDLVKGEARLIVENGRVLSSAMKTAHLTDKDLHEDLRAHGLTGPDHIAEARLERNGQLSVIKAAAGPKVVEVAVQEGVQTVRIELP
ncbi:Protein of unknown function [Faunimonas pinastri]|uniref:YetF C-terminal domain-containing protein n=1 Tax=Faunimonas pinastri TaxID=1855383 RepID=A0A1H9HGC8_9HYPH|nr:YetF domain-containing protein [Faunimonas pinastri]SEQ61312.1 Protein of unknown function [Faunimonas pinastri]